ncbi:hypothetical protein E2P81_ATG03081 [Venturia nashicola]|uniref:Uncharacterized protein n=1 Tax=Venturia nashicola TaxID=86259 RepID=A0A4Z1PLX2_9PEZI|nr:hypothetical protein E6O75_ATG03148 [Venturia nashicola]TLD36192.1 hypothetical protein E2P81_ATG03081 [Venturia nashicola]
MKFSLLFLTSLVTATPIAQFGGGKSFACQHDHLHVNPECKSGGAGAGSAGGAGALANLLKGAGGAGGLKGLGGTR